MTHHASPKVQSSNSLPTGRQANVKSSPNCKCEAPRPQAGASRKGNVVHIVPLDPAYKAGLVWHLPVKNKSKFLKFELCHLSLI
jgi:hypothetical protein